MIDTILANLLALCVGAFFLILCGLLAVFLISFGKLIGEHGPIVIAFLIASWSSGRLLKRIAEKDIGRGY